MATITLFDDLPDLTIIELFTYLSSVDILWAFADLNNRLRALLVERGFVRHINLSFARLSQFDTLLRLLSLDKIESLAIDSYASPLQLIRWPYLPRLKTFLLKGFLDFRDVSTFVLRHAATLVNLIFETHELFLTFGFTGNISYPRGHFVTLVENLLHHLTKLRSLDLGKDDESGVLSRWPVAAVQSPLIYLRVCLQSMDDVYLALSTEPLSQTLQQFRVTMRSFSFPQFYRLPLTSLPRMMHLHTFTFAQSIFSRVRLEWEDFEVLTDPRVMPVLRRANLALFISVDDFDQISQSSLFTDERRVDVQFAFILIKCPQDLQYTHCVPRGSRFHPRQIVGAKCVVRGLSYNEELLTNDDVYLGGGQCCHHVWYTLPWAFDEFFRLVYPIKCITEVQAFALPPMSSVIGRSQLRTLNISQNGLRPAMFSLPHVVQSDRIDTVHVAYCDWPNNLHLNAVRHIILTNNLTSLTNFSFPPSVRSIQIVLHDDMPHFVACNWSALRSLSSMPMLNSLSVLFNNMNTILDDINWQIIAEIVPIFVNFSLCFRSRFGHGNSDHEFPFNNYRTFIKQLHYHILQLQFGQEPHIVVEEEGCGITVWRF